MTCINCGSGNTVSIDTFETYDEKGNAIILDVYKCLKCARKFGMQQCHSQDVHAHLPDAAHRYPFAFRDITAL